MTRFPHTPWSRCRSWTALLLPVAACSLHNPPASAEQTWTAPQVLGTNTQRSGRLNAGATDGKGNWVQVWAECYESPGWGCIQPPALSALRSGHSSDDGESWGTTEIFSPDYEDPWYAPTIATDGRGTWLTLVLTWDEIVGVRSRSNGRDWERTSQPAGFVWADPVITPSAPLTLATDGSGAWVAAWCGKDRYASDPRQVGLYLSRSSDAGETWITHRVVSSGAGHPKLACDAAGQWVLLWQDTQKTGATYSTSLYFTRSSDHGATWTSPSLLVRGYATSPEDPRLALALAPDLIRAPSGHWIVAYASNTNLAGSGTDYDLLWHLSEDAGRNWSLPRLINSLHLHDVSDQKWPQLLALEGMEFGIVWGLQSSQNEITLKASDTSRLVRQLPAHTLGTAQAGMFAAECSPTGKVNCTWANGSLYFSTTRYSPVLAGALDWNHYE